MDLLTVREVAEKLKIDETTVYKWRGQGILRAVPLSRKVLRFRGQDIQDFIESRLVPLDSLLSHGKNQQFRQKKSFASGDSKSKGQIERLVENARREVFGHA